MEVEEERLEHETFIFSNLIIGLSFRYVREGGVTIGDIYIPPPPAPACTLDATGAASVCIPSSN